jgi:uncharacterized membrane protein
MKTKRIWEIDALRGIAILMMIVFHVLWALNYFGLIHVPHIDTGFWRAFAYTTASIFIFLVGVSLTLSYSRVKKTKENYIGKYLKRGIRIFCYGLVITLMTALFFKEGLVFFGILHFIGVGIILSIPFLRFNKLNLLFGTIFIIAGLLLRQIVLTVPWFVLFGVRYWGMVTFDYYPILPWLGVILLGVFIGKQFYQNGKSKIKVPAIPLKEILSFLGRNSLLIYFVHLIVIFTAIFIIKQI